MPRELIDTRKRPRSPGMRRDSVQARSSPPPKRIARPNSDLGSMLRPSNIPHAQYKTIQASLTEQAGIINHLENELNQQSDQVRRLERALSHARDAISMDRERLRDKEHEAAILERQLQIEKTISRDLREREKFHDIRLKDQERLMDLGTDVLANKNQENDALQSEVLQLQATVGERDSTIASLNERAISVAMAAPTDWAAMAMEEQAKRTLNMVKGLQSDVAHRDSMIATEAKRIKALTTANAAFQDEIGQIHKTQQELTVNAEASKKQLSEAQSILDDQAALIKRLMQENTLLSIE